MREHRAVDPASLFASPNALASDYSRFRVAERLLLTGHSHQAWPDRAFAGQVEAFEDAAEHVDDKWERAFGKAERVRRGFASLLEDSSGCYALGPNTHDLMLRFLSALPLKSRGRLVTTDGEFHSVRRQLRRLEEEGLEVVRVPSSPVEAVAGRLAAALDEKTAAVLVSAVFFRSAEILPAEGLRQLALACARRGVELLVDGYHAVNAMPFPLGPLGLEDAFVVGGGYKYCQMGEGNCFLRLPPDREDLRPVLTGWFSEFSALPERPGAGDAVVYGEGADRFAGSTYDPTSHYRASEVFDFFSEKGLTPRLLRRVSQHQVGLLKRRIEALGLPAELLRSTVSAPLESLGGFLALTSPRAGAISEDLRRRGVWTDYREDVLRLGPAPYSSDRQLEDAVGILGRVASGLLAAGRP